MLRAFYIITLVLLAVVTSPNHPIYTTQNQQIFGYKKNIETTKIQDDKSVFQPVVTRAPENK